MRTRVSTLALATFFSVVSAGTADKKVKPIRAGNDVVDVTASAVVQRDEVKTSLGTDPGVDLVLIDIEVRPKGEDKLKLSRDDFTLISRKDGQRVQAMHPSQVAGSAVLVVSSTSGGASAGFGTPRRGPIWGGVPGTTDRPRRIGGDDDGVVAGVGEARADAKTQGGGKEDPALAVLKAKELKLEPTAEPAKGFLYFVFEGKHKLKDLELMYKTPDGTLMLDFEK